MHLLSDEKVCCRLLAQVAGRCVVGHLLGRSEACGSGLANRIRGLRSGRACAAPPVCRRPVYVARGTASAHTVRLFLVQEVASVPTRVELHLSKQPMVFAVQVHVKPRGLGTRVSSQPAAPQPGKAGRWRACHGALRICGRGRWTCEDRTWGHSDVSLVSL